MYPTGICYQAYIPMRRHPESTSEMVNQVLFGESFSILSDDKQKSFSLISLLHDQYEGWINTHCIYYLSEEEWSSLKKLPVLVTHEVFNLLKPVNTIEPLIIGSGSLLRISSPGKIKIDQNEFHIPEIKKEVHSKFRENIVINGLKLLSIPYLWGARGGFGFDCSGMVQNLYRQAGIEIPRDASAQSTFGKTLSFIDEAQPGDLAFFDNEEGKIIHVGMILEKGKILHASGRVKIDEIDHQGIFSKEQNRYTHSLRLVRNIVVN